MPKGDDLDRLAKVLDDGHRKVMSAAGLALADSLAKSADEGYRKRRDVNGKTFKRAKDGHLPQMERTGNLRHDYTRGARVDGVDDIVAYLRNDTDYSEYLRDGTEKMDARKHMPSPGDNMPDLWDARARRDIDAAVKKAAP